MNRLENKVALITGGSSGQGAAEARLFSKEGAAVVIVDVNDKPGEELAAAIRGEGGKALYLHLDVAEEADWISAVAETKKAFGALHVLVNNAGIMRRQTVMGTTREAWDIVVAVNMTGPALGMKAAAPLIRDSGGGSIINVSSVAGLVPHFDAAYTASKFGLRGLTKTASVEFAPWQIRVNSIHPSQVSDTGFFRTAQPGNADSARMSIPWGRQGTPLEMAQAVLFLASDESVFITGAEIAVDGGYTAGSTLLMRNKIRDDAAKASR